MKVLMTSRDFSSAQGSFTYFCLRRRTNLTELKEHLDNSLRDRVGLLGCSMQSQELDSVMIVDPFQARMYHGHMKSVP